MRYIHIYNATELNLIKAHHNCSFGVWVGEDKLKLLKCYRRYQFGYSDYRE